MSRKVIRNPASCLVVAAALLVPATVSAQAKPPTPAGQTAPSPPASKDTLGRDTPRGTVLGFMNAGREGRTDIARLYLDTKLRDDAAVELARRLYVVLDRRLSTRINDISDQPEGSRANVLQPTQDTIGTIKTASGPLELFVERVNRGSLGPVWLFSRKTLDVIPDVYDEFELDRVQIDRFLPEFFKTRILRHQASPVAGAGPAAAVRDSA